MTARFGPLSKMWTVFTAVAVGILCANYCAHAQNVHTFSIPNQGYRSGNNIEPVQVTLNLQQSVSTIGTHFVGVTIDTSMARYNWATLDFSSKRLQNLARGLVPTYFRLGGTQADCMTFDPNKDDTERTKFQDVPNLQKYKPDLSNFTLSAKQWVDLNTFVGTVGWDFIMDLNALQRENGGPWNTTNARKLLQFSAERNFSIAGFELGNEYDLYKEAFNRTVTPAQLAADMFILQDLLREFPKYSSSFIIGPETAIPRLEYFGGFLLEEGARIVRASSFHQYYFNGNTGQLNQFTNVGVFDLLKDELETGLFQSRVINPQLPVWLSETSSAYNGGAANISDRFVAGFLWLDKLGVCANMGVETVIRQDFYGINYGLIDEELYPNPDYWLTVLFKRLVRGSVFSVDTRRQVHVRLYAACANPDTFNEGALALFYLNPNNYSVTFDLQQFKDQKLQLYILTSGDSEGLLSKYSALNGVKLQMNGDELPSLQGKTQDPGPVITPPYSFGFMVLPDADVTLCSGK